MRITLRSQVGLIALFLAFGLMAQNAAAASINVSATSWGTRSENGVYNTNMAPADSWILGYTTGGQNTGQNVRAYWGFDLGGLGTITDITLVAYMAGVNYQDISTWTQARDDWESVRFLGPDTADGTGAAFTWADLAGPAVYPNYVQARMYRNYWWRTICVAQGDPNCEADDVYVSPTGLPAALTFNSTELDHVNAAASSPSGMFWLSAFMPGPQHHSHDSEALVFLGSAPGNLEGTSSVDEFYLKITYTPAAPPVPEPASFGLMAAGLLGAFVACRKRSRS